MPVYYLVEKIEDPESTQLKEFVIITGIQQTGHDKWYYVGNLHVHHTYYQYGNEPWEYPSKALITLCWNCHESLHKDTTTPILNSDGIEVDRLNVCKRCSGAGWFPQYRHVQNGICFRCDGAKYEELIR